MPRKVRVDLPGRPVREGVPFDDESLADFAVRMLARNKQEAALIRKQVNDICDLDLEPPPFVRV